MSFAPVIPPYPSPSGGHSPEPPPLVHALSPNGQPSTPSWAQSSSFSGASPYTAQMQMASAPGTYMVPPVALPAGGQPPVAPVGPSGFSPDYVGLAFNGLSPYMMPPGMMPAMMPPGAMPPGPPPAQAHPSTPHHGAAATAQMYPTTGYMYPQQLPPQMQAGYAPQMQAGYPPQMQAGYPPQVQAGYPPPGAAIWGMTGGMPAQHMTPYPMAGVWPTPFVGYGAGALPPQGMPAAQAAPAAAAAHRSRSRGRGFRPQDVSEFDKVDKFAEGEHYGPALDPFVLRRVRARVELNPLLEPPQEGLNHAFLKWNMLFPTAQCQRSTDPAGRSWHAGRHAPATWPRLTSLRLISRELPWPLQVAASNPALGVSCGDVIEVLHQYMYEKCLPSEYNRASDAKQRVLREIFYYNRSTAYGVPGGRLPNMLLRCDWLGRNTAFGGLVHDEQLVRQLCGAPIPAVFELRCVESWPVTEEEQREIQAREMEADERLRRRGRSRAASRTSRTTSQASSRPPSQATSRSRAATVEDASDEDE